MRERGFRMWIVRRPHDVASTGHVAGKNSNAVVDERGIDVAVHEIARLMFQNAVHPVTLLVPGFIHIVCGKGQPA